MRTFTIDPTPEQIAEACQKIQRGWSDAQERHRRGCRGGVKPYEFPLIDRAALRDSKISLEEE